jgi:hypothetical protein
MTAPQSQPPVAYRVASRVERRDVGKTDMPGGRLANLEPVAGIEQRTYREWATARCSPHVWAKLSNLRGFPPRGLTGRLAITPEAIWEEIA